MRGKNKKKTQDTLYPFGMNAIVVQLRTSLLDKPWSKSVRASNGLCVRGKVFLQRGGIRPNSGNPPLHNHSRCMVFCRTTSCDQMWNQTFKKNRQNHEKNEEREHAYSNDNVSLLYSDAHRKWCNCSPGHTIGTWICLVVVIYWVAG